MGIIKRFIDQHDTLNTRQSILGAILGVVTPIFVLLSLSPIGELSTSILSRLSGVNINFLHFFEGIAFFFAFAPILIIPLALGGFIIGCNLGKNNQLHLLVRFNFYLLVFLVILFATNLLAHYIVACILDKETWVACS